MIDGPIGAAFLAGRTREAEATLARAIDDPIAAIEDRQGVVHLVGAGPGDPDLLTLRALHVLQSADVIFYDDLVGPEILDRARRDAERVFVGKRKGAPGIGQAEINRRLIEAAQAGPLRRPAERRRSRSSSGAAAKSLMHLRAGADSGSCRAGHHRRARLRRRGRTAADLPHEATRLSLVTANTAEGAAAVDWARAVGSARRRSSSIWASRRLRSSVPG